MQQEFGCAPQAAVLVLLGMIKVLLAVITVFELLCSAPRVVHLLLFDASHRLETAGLLTVPLLLYARFLEA